MFEDIYIQINLIKTIVMGCGCKNKGNQQAAQQAPISTAQKPAVPNQTVQESVKKVIEKY